MTANRQTSQSALPQSAFESSEEDIQQTIDLLFVPTYHLKDAKDW
jgi:hypothetical protein